MNHVRPLLIANPRVRAILMADGWHNVKPGTLASHDGHFTFTEWERGSRSERPVVGVEDALLAVAYDWESQG